MKKVSILMSIYNESEKEIKESINSVLDQTYSNIELIIVIDNPRECDKYLNILADFRMKNENIVIYCNNENIGLAMSMNKGFELSTGEYIARMDADDISLKKRIEVEVDKIESGKYDFVFSGFSYIDENSNELPGTYKYIEPNKINNTLLTTNCIHHPTVLMKKEIFEKMKGYRDFPCSQDYDLWLRLLQSNCKFFMIDDILLKYRIRNNSTTSRKRFLQACTLFYISGLFFERIETKKDSYSKDNYEHFINNCERKYRFHKNHIDFYQKLQKKLGYNKIIDISIRLFLITTNRFIRDNYLLKIKIKKRGIL